MKTAIISASLLSADFAELGKETTAVLNAGADWVHLDIMDNHYVPNLTFGSMICRSLRRYGITAPIDVHLMVRPVDRLIQDFADAGATYISIHPEATDHLDRSLQLIRDLGCKSGIALNPATPLEILTHVMDKLDVIMLMSVNPGFSNQRFIPEAFDKIQDVRQRIDRHGGNQRLEVDGGIKAENIREVALAGADTFVMGSAIFDTQNYFQTIKTLRTALEDDPTG